MVVGMIHVGGITRLTHSGLSMTSWSPLGSLPPMTREEWEEEFGRYKQYPEWEQRKQMTLREFQFIYAWEYGHRMLGRCVGLVFVLPWVYFTVRKRIPAGYQPRMLGLLAMGGSQGLLGWWMVKSGLGDDRRGDKQEIRVKPLRLGTHLCMAFATYAALLWTGWDILAIHQTAAMKEQVKKLSEGALKHASRLRTGGIGVTSLTAITILSGAMVAGNDAGRAYNTFPLMHGRWIPPEVLDGSMGWLRRFSEDTASVQFNHRWLGMATAGSSLGLLALGKPHLLTPQARRGLYAIGAVTCGQVGLGITTLLTYVPISLAALHQLGSVVVFTSGLYLVHSLRYARPAILRTIRPTNAKVVTAGAARAVKETASV